MDILAPLIEQAKRRKAQLEQLQAQPEQHKDAIAALSVTGSLSTLDTLRLRYALLDVNTQLEAYRRLQALQHDQFAPLASFWSLN